MAILGRLIVLGALLMACGGSTATPNPSPSAWLGQPLPSATPTAQALAPPLPTPTCPPSGNPIRRPPQALPPSAGACPP